ncbi:MAG: PEP/pyruvate-binding domain-containing protein [Candidatus Heimdallarchaeota archaeon]
MKSIQEEEKLVFAFRELKQNQEILAGGKGGTLARLVHEGFPVPDGAIIVPNAFDEDQLLPEAWEQVKTYLRGVRQRNGSISFAVRSSALAEDSATASFGGQFETVLDVKTDEEIREAITVVHKSRLNERVEAYSRAKGLTTDHEIAVILQQLVRSEISGVLFTADPVSGSRNNMVGNYAYGMGDQLVSGEVDAYEFTITRPKGKYNGPPELKRYARVLFKHAKAIENKLDAIPQDIEWAVANERVFILQSRPITTLIGKDHTTGYYNESLTGDYLWTQTGIGEILPQVMSPMEWSLWRLYNVELMEHDWFHPHLMIGNIAGRAYMNVSILVSIMRKMKIGPLGYSEERINEVLMENMMGDIPENMKIPTFPVSWRKILFKMIPDEFKWQRAVKRYKKQFPDFLGTHSAKCNDFQERINTLKARADLISFWNDELRPDFVNTVFMLKTANEVYINPLNDLSIKIGKITGKEIATILIQGPPKAERLESLGPMLGLADILEGKISREEYMERYGHRDPNENYLIYSRPAEEPDWLEKQLQEYQKTPFDFDSILTKRQEDFERAIDELRNLVKPRKFNSIIKQINELTEEMHTREEIRSELTRIIWIIRLYLLKVGEITQLNDGVFYLEEEELLDVLSGKEEVISLIPKRKEMYNKLISIPPIPGLINGRFTDPFQWAKDPNKRADFFDSHVILDIKIDPDLVVGVPGSSGRIEGLVRIINDPDEGENLQPGEILVTRTTNVGWTPLFTKTTAIITDVGAPLSHAAIVARELGIPAVVGCTDATARLQTGDRVLVDGGNGTVKILAKAN